MSAWRNEWAREGRRLKTGKSGACGPAGAEGRVGISMGRWMADRQFRLWRVGAARVENRGEHFTLLEEVALGPGLRSTCCPPTVDQGSWLGQGCPHPR
jgi:hypothetical protein